MASDNDVYWFGSYLHVLVMIAFLGNMWRTKNCSGISLRSQFLYALVFSTRHQDLVTYNDPAINIIVKIVYLIVTYGTVMSMLMYFPKTYEKQNDKSRIGIWIIACILMSFFLNDRFDFLEILTVFSFYLEAIAMIPQYEFIIKTERIDKNVILYIVAMTGYTVLYVAYLGHEYRTRPYRYSLRSAAAAIQLLLHCDFFYRIYHLLSPDDDQSEGSNRGFLERIYSMVYCRKSRGDVESEVPKTGHLANNVGKIVLESSDITGVDRDKKCSSIEETK